MRHCKNKWKMKRHPAASYGVSRFWVTNPPQGGGVLNPMYFENAKHFRAHEAINGVKILLFAVFLAFFSILFSFPLPIGERAYAANEAWAADAPAQLSPPPGGGTAAQESPAMADQIKTALLIGLGVAALVVLVMFLLHRASLRRAPGAAGYAGEKGLRLSERSDVFISTHTTRRRIQKNPRK